MRPIKTANSNFTYKGPDPSIADLPCQVTPELVMSVWEPTPREREAIMNGANVRLAVWARPTPPVCVDVVDEPERRDEN